MVFGPSVHHYPFITRNYALESQLSIEVIPPPKMLSKMYKHLSIYPRSNCSLIDFFNTCLTVLKGFLQICNTCLKRLLEATEQKCVRHTSAAELHYASGKSILSNRLLTQQPKPVWCHATHQSTMVNFVAISLHFFGSRDIISPWRLTRDETGGIGMTFIPRCGGNV